jgi:hypothetical protein
MNKPKLKAKINQDIKNIKRNGSYKNSECFSINDEVDA